MKTSKPSQEPRPYARMTSRGTELRLKVIPGARKAGIAGILGKRLKIKVTAPPEHGRANHAVLELIRSWSGCPRAELLSGHAQPEKTILLIGIAPEDLPET
jgi:uncharacterized protein